MKNNQVRVLSFISDSSKGLTSDPNITQDDVLSFIAGQIALGNCVCTKMVSEKGTHSYGFSIVDESINSKTGKKEMKKVSLVVKVSAKNYKLGDPNIQELETLVKNGKGIVRYNQAKLVADKAKRFVAGTVAAALTITSMAAATALIGKKLMEADEQEWNSRNQRIESFYTNEYGVDSRSLPSYSDPGGRFVDDDRYYSSDGKMYVITEEGTYLEVTPEEYQESMDYGNELDEKGKSR